MRRKKEPINGWCDPDRHIVPPWSFTPNRTVDFGDYAGVRWHQLPKKELKALSSGKSGDAEPHRTRREWAVKEMRRRDGLQT